ncbi:peptidoglycan DD-metalloendopeptidase family protein [Halobacillus sp. Marseille-Q1614]|uniref:peptidoglycan DD-metalloendopeptidase family protein n=1 Tax=Halobacillus sp. Marseille-Q1614 TaxID=2709134 RepID=UPI00156F7A78|nr:peptidoglycan DD-metalloendopeptidase family protein [Halobacillus sp. Marseille-Q1614]
MEDAVIRRGTSTGALLIKIGLPAILILLIIVPIAAVILALSSESGEGVNTGNPSQIAKNEIPAKYMPIYQAAGEKYNVPWNLLAAHHKVETNFGEGNIESYAGAIGVMQFMPCSWIGWGYPSCGGLGDLDIGWNTLLDLSVIEEYGGFGVDGNADGKADPRDPEDAIFAAASYLAANGADDGMIEEAVFAYNHSNEYVTKVLEYSELYVEAGSVTGGGEFVWPVPFTTEITSLFGNRPDPMDGSTAFHGGIDIAAAGVHGKSVVAAAPGKVVMSGNAGGYGKAIYIDHGNGLKTIYGHLSALNVPQGVKVKAGQEIGQVGSTGRSTGPHLHFTVEQDGKEIDPIQFFQ